MRFVLSEHKVKEGESVPLAAEEEGNIRYDSDYVYEGPETYDTEKEYSVEEKTELEKMRDDHLPKPETIAAHNPMHPASQRPLLSDRITPPKSILPKIPNRPTLADAIIRRPLTPNRYSTLDKRPPHRFTPGEDRSDVRLTRPKPSSGGTRATLPFIHRQRPGGRPSFIPPRKTAFRLPTTTEFVSTSTVPTTTISMQPTISTTTILPTSTQKTTTTSSPFYFDIASFLGNIGSGEERPNILLPGPIQQATKIDSGELENLLLHDEFKIGQVSETAYS